MRITRIEIKDFRAFRGQPVRIDLTTSGKNLLVYGENGSGKSSLFLALKLFLECAGTRDFLEHRNFSVTTDDGYVKLTVLAEGDNDSGNYEWSKGVNDTGKRLILEMDKTKGFVDYKALLATYFLHQKQDWVNIFDLLLQEILCKVENDLTKHSFGEDWRKINSRIPTRNTKIQLYLVDSIIKQFNDGLRVKLDELTSETNGILHHFGYDIKVEFHFGGVAYNRASRRIEKGIDKCEVRLKVKFSTYERDDHHHYLNEAKLSAIALSIFFAALKLQPVSRLRILALDDVLIGLDMANRMPVLEIIDQHFSNYQIFFFTYDNPWFEVVKRRWNEKRWKYTELRLIRTDNEEFILCTEDKPYLAKADQYLQKNEYKPAVIYVRSAFEEVLKSFCKRKKLSVRYTDKAKELDTDDFWKPIKNGKKRNDDPFVTPSLATAIDQARSNVLNPLSHADVQNWHRPEIQNALAVVRQLKIELDAIGPQD